MIDINDLISKIETEFDDLTKGILLPESEFKKVINWSSINAVVITAMIEFEYGVLILPDEMFTTNTITELFELINRKRA
jgi:acyl carrier protein